MRKYILFIFIIIASGVSAQIDSSLLNSVPDDSIQGKMNLDAVYSRPFITSSGQVSIGGYLESHYEYIGTDGVTPGHSFKIPRMTLFVASSITHNIRFMSELEFEEGGEEISIEFAAVDVNLHSLLNFRAGIIMNPIGAFNQNHDGPLWEFVERPVAMSQMLPATWSNPGFGVYGKKMLDNWSFAYEYYLSNGFDEKIIDNSEGKTFLPATKEDKERFLGSSNGHLMQTAKIASKYKGIELGISYMGGVYNQTASEGIDLSAKRRLDVFAVDVNGKAGDRGPRFIGEWVYIMLDIPDNYLPTYGQQQQGGYLDLIQNILSFKVLNFNNAQLNLACRFEYADWNLGTFKETGASIGQEFWAIVPGISFRPVSTSVLRLNYRYGHSTDFLGNPPAISGGIQLGIASYF